MHHTTHAQKFVASHGSQISDGYDQIISMLLASAPEGTQAHSRTDEKRTIYTFPDNSAAHVLQQEDGSLEAFECIEGADELLSYINASQPDLGGVKPEGEESDDAEEDEGDEEEELEEA